VLYCLLFLPSGPRSHFSDKVHRCSHLIMLFAMESTPTWTTWNLFTTPRIYHSELGSPGKPLARRPDLLFQWEGESFCNLRVKRTLFLPTFSYRSTVIFRKTLLNSSNLDALFHYRSVLVPRITAQQSRWLRHSIGVHKYRHFTNPISYACNQEDASLTWTSPALRW